MNAYNPTPLPTPQTRFSLHQTDFSIVRTSNTALWSSRMFPPRTWAWALSATFWYALSYRPRIWDGQEAISPSGVVAEGGATGGAEALLKSNVPRLIWTTGMVGSSRSKVRARDEMVEWLAACGALKGGCNEGTMDGVRKIILDDGWERSCC